MQETDSYSPRYSKFHDLIAGLVAATIYAVGMWLSLELRSPGEIPPKIAPILSLLSTPGLLLNYALRPPTSSQYQISYVLGSLVFWFVAGYFSLKITKRVWAALLLWFGFAIFVMMIGFGVILFAMREMSP